MKGVVLLICIGLLVALAMAQSPPLPPVPASVMERVFARSLGSQNPYWTIVDVRATSVVTTVYDVSYTRMIRVFPGTNGAASIMKTNFVLMDTNQISSVTNTSPIKPE